MFEDLLSQAIKGAGASANGSGGVNPAQVGLGVKVAGINTNFAQGASQLTGRATDLSIQGDGFFIANQGGQTLFSRVGSLSLDADGRLVTPDGAVIQGWNAAADGTINTNGAVSNLVIPLGQAIAPAQTAKVTLGGNVVPAPDPTNPAAPVNTSITIYDSQGTPTQLTLMFDEQPDGSSNVSLPDSTDPTQPAAPPLGNLAFGPDGKLVPQGGAGPNDPYLITFDPAAAGLAGNWGGASIDLDFGVPGTANAATEYAGQGSMAATAQDGSGMGNLQSFSIAPNGVLNGVFSNGKTQPLGQIALATFNNPAGMEKVGSSLWRPTVNSGVPQIGPASSGNRGTLSGGTLEMSNVDLAQEFTNLIVAERGFQANSRVITASDELLQDLVNLTR